MWLGIMSPLLYRLSYAARKNSVALARGDGQIEGASSVAMTKRV